MISFAKSYYYLLNRSSICYFYNTVYFFSCSHKHKIYIFCERFFVKEEKYKIKKADNYSRFCFLYLENKQTNN